MIPEESRTHIITISKRREKGRVIAIEMNDMPIVLWFKWMAIYADICIVQAFIIHNPFEDPPGLDDLLKKCDCVMNTNSSSTNAATADDKNDNIINSVNVTASPA